MPKFKLAGERPALFALGACDLNDSLIIPSIVRSYEIRSITSTSLLSMFTPPGMISFDILEYFHKNKHLESKYQLLLSEVQKNVLETWKLTATSYDYLIISFSTEFYTKFYDDKECLTLLPHLEPIPGFNWFNDCILKPNKFHLEFDEEKNLSLQQDLLYEFAQKVEEIFQDRVILVRTHLTDKVIHGEKIFIQNVATKHIANYHNKKFQIGEKNSNYGQRLVDAMLKQFKRCYKHDIPIVKVPDQLIYRDGKHKWGSQPFHLHNSSTLFIGSRILEELKKKEAKAMLSKKTKYIK